MPLAAYDLVSGIKGGCAPPPRGRLTAGLDLEADWITFFRRPVQPGLDGMAGKGQEEPARTQS